MLTRDGTRGLRGRPTGRDGASTRLSSVQGTRCVPCSRARPWHARAAAGRDPGEHYSVGVLQDQPRTRRAAAGVRTPALWADVREVAVGQAAQLGRPIVVLDLGGGTGELAVPLAALGPDTVAAITVVDPSPDALAALHRRAAESDVAGRVTALQGDADTLAEIVPLGSFDVVCCHGVLEVVDDPAATLRAVSAALAPAGVVSLAAAGRLAAVLSRALVGEFDQAHVVLTGPTGSWGEGDPLPRRFDLHTLRALVNGAGLEVDGWRGTRVLSDLVPSVHVDTDAQRTALLALEDTLAGHPAYPLLGELGAALHVIARAG